MERVKGNADRKQNIEVRWLVDDAPAREQPLEILKEEISVFEKPEHAQIHAHTGDQPAAARTPLGLRNLPPQPEIHRGCGKKECGKGRIPRAVKDVAGGDEEIFPQRPGTDATIEYDTDYAE